MATTLFIDGTWQASSSGKSYQVRNPATMEIVGDVADGNRADTKAAVDAAARALPAWAGLPARQRGAILDRAYRIMVERREALARTLTIEEGKPLYEARGEIDYAADFLLWYAHEAPRLYGEVVPFNVPNKRQMALRQPLGVVGAITPWNFPAAMVTRKVAPALAAGCTVVFKPAEQTPFTAIEIFKILEEAGLPAGVCNLVTSDTAPEIGAELLENPVVRKISFTGSTEVGKFLMREGAKQVKKLSLELGGHAPLLVFEDADLDRAVDGAVYAKFRNMGQTCISANRFLVHEKVLEPFLQRFEAKVRALKVGNGLEDGVLIGPMIDQNGQAKALEHVNDAVSRGATVVCGGKAPTGSQFAKGYWMEPTVLSGVTPEMKMFSEETFGPVAPVIPFRTDEEAVALANRSAFGLASYAFTRDVTRVMKVSEALEYGMVGINDPAPTGAHAPFGGIKESGIGREGGHYGIEEFTYVKFVSIGI